MPTFTQQANAGHSVCVSSADLAVSVAAARWGRPTGQFRSHQLKMDNHQNQASNRKRHQRGETFWCIKPSFSKGENLIILPASAEQNVSEQK